MAKAERRALPAFVGREAYTTTGQIPARCLALFLSLMGSLAQFFFIVNAAAAKRPSSCPDPVFTSTTLRAGAGRLPAKKT